MEVDLTFWIDGCLCRKHLLLDDQILPKHTPRGSYGSGDDVLMDLGGLLVGDDAHVGRQVEHEREPVRWTRRHASQSVSPSLDGKFTQ